MYSKTRLTLLGIAFLFTHVHAQNQPTLKLVQTIPLIGVHGKFDHMAYDGHNQKIYLAAKLNNSIEVVDLKSNRIAHSIKEVSLPQGVLYLSRENMILVCGGGDGTLKGFDATNYKIKFTLKLGEEADNIRYSAIRHKIYVAYGDGAIAEMDDHTFRKTAEIPFQAHPEAFQFDASSKKMWVNVPNKELIKVLNADNNTEITSWKTPGHEDNFPMTLIEKPHKLIVASRKNPVISILSNKTGKVLQTFSCDSDPDAMFYDEKTDRVFVSCGGGSLYILNQVSAPMVKKPIIILTRKGARTCLWVSELNILFVALPEAGGKVSEIRMYK